MDGLAIDLERLKAAVSAIFDHLIEDLKLKTVQIDEKEDFYWHCESPEVYDVSKKPTDLGIGRLSDDMDFVKLIQRGQSGDASYTLVHVAPLLRYIAEKVGK
ncbi:MAG: hypothetical protein WAN23_03275 [Candidatus Acidiferrales bacterium]